MSPPPRARPIVLVGLRGAGKTAVGAVLAETLGRRLVDIDEAVEARAGRSIARIFAEGGEESFRALEARALREALAAPDAVVAPGGGAVLLDENRDAIRHAGALVFYLRARPEVLAARVEGDARSGERRPRLRGASDVDEARALEVERDPLYRAVATSVVETEGRSIDEVAAEVLRLIAD